MAESPETTQKQCLLFRVIVERTHQDRDEHYVALPLGDKKATNSDVLKTIDDKLTISSEHTISIDFIGKGYLPPIFSYEK